ncbi:pif1 [Peridroma alphabaculovirus]|uniref:Pif1 n=1 Tax=Peridroma alphabaculovirus TaxID=1346829 RepID=A0A068LKF4_9ABAC|nr:pif1 [Peridroma alphabaculovirus]AIE47762.1 pif1 [Peridroma alphabaculovirus]
MYLLVALALLVFVILFLQSYIALLTGAQEETINPLPRFDNTGVPLIAPPREIVVEGNEHECHKELTPCETHLDCDVCREGLANCQYFDEQTLITITQDDGEQITHTIKPGESYCLALDRERARSCNPYTGLWLLAESPVGYSLLCSCLAPGLVTQLSLYHDCDVPVGCQPHGHIHSIFESPIRCVCDEGFRADYDTATQTPFCRPLRIRDVITNTNLFPHAPCAQGFIPLSHPGLNPYYARQTLEPDLCVVDPCSIDPISGQRHSGRLVHETVGDEVLNYCSCSIRDNLFSVYNDQQNMLAPSTRPIVNACLRPFNADISHLIRVDYKFFWGHADRSYSDEDVVAIVHEREISHPRYRRMLFDRSAPHPEVVLAIPGYYVMKISTAYSPMNLSAPEGTYGHNTFTRFLSVMSRTTAPCLYPGVGRCITVNPNLCIRRHNNAAVGSAEFFTGQTCLLSRDNHWLKIWNPASRYRGYGFPVVMRCMLMFERDWNNRQYTTILLVYGHQMIRSFAGQDVLRQVVDTYANYSVN